MSFRVILWLVGALLACASRVSPRVRRQIGRDLAVCVRTRDGVARTFVFRDRRVSSVARDTPDAACVLTFANASQGTRCFLAADCIDRIIDALAQETVTVTGEATFVVWFYEMTMACLPWHTPRITDLPDRYVAHDPASKVASRITREPAAAALDPQWTAAVRQREKLIMWEVARGAPVPGKPRGFRHVVRAPEGAAGNAP